MLPAICKTSFCTNIIPTFYIPLLKLITSPDSETKVTTLFHYHGVKREIQKWKEVDASPTLSENEKEKILLKCKISISKYAKVALLANSFMRRNSSLEIRIVDSEKYNLEKLKEIQRETFALIRLKGKNALYLLLPIVGVFTALGHQWSVVHLNNITQRITILLEF